MFHTTLVAADEFGYNEHRATMNKYFPEWTLLLDINVKSIVINLLKKELIFIN